MHVLSQLNDMLEEQVEGIIRKGDISPTELDNAMKAVKTMNYIETIKAMKEYGSEGSNQGSNQGQSNRGSYRGSYGNSNQGNSNRGSYNSYDGSYGSYDGRRGRDGDSDGRYSEESSYRRGRDARGRYTSRDGYSREDEKEEMISKVEKMMDSAKSEMERQTIMECIRNIDN